MIYPKWRLATTEAGLAKGYLAFLSLPFPRSNYQNHSARVPQGDGGLAVHGYSNDVLTWGILTPAQLHTVESIVSTAVSNGVIYATVPAFLGGVGGRHWIDISGKAQPLDVDKRTDNFNILATSSVVLTINNITVVNDPSTA